VSFEVPRDPAALALSAIRSVSAINADDFKQIAEALAGLYSVRSIRDVPVEEFVEDVCDAMEIIPEEQLRLPLSEREQFKGKLRTLMGAELFAIAAKAYDLATDDERTFCGARILTDLRPVFGGRIEDGPRAMVVVHLLKLAYHQGSDKHEQFYLSLDDGDLKELRRLIDRAEAKAATLRSAVKDVRLFGVPKE
jgi:hypothetical protein